LTRFLIRNTVNLMILLKSKNIVALGIVAFLAMSFWSLFSMSMDMNGHMANCPFMDSLSSFCQMSASEHITQWQQFFAMTKEKNLLLSLFFLCVAVFAIQKAYDKLRHQHFRNYFYQHTPEIKLFNYFALAFSQGLIHPKIYA